MREPISRSVEAKPFAPRIEYHITTQAVWDGIGIYHHDECVMLQNFTTSKYVQNGDVLNVDLSDIYGLVAASGNASFIRSLSVKLHRYDTPERGVFRLRGRLEPIDLCQQRLTDWLAEGF